MYKKLDSELRLLIEKQQRSEKKAFQRGLFALRKKRTVRKGKLAIIVRYENESAPLEALGFQIRYRGVKILTGTIAPEHIPALAEHPNVRFIELDKPVKPLLNESIPAVKADEVRTVNADSDTWTGFTGEGVIVGVIDSGVDYRHPSFIKENGETRFKWIWDIGRDPADDDGVAPAAFTGVASPDGTEYSEALINTALAADDPYAVVGTKDVKKKDNGDLKPNGHGTHVLGIAAGNGKDGDRCRGKYTYAGIAPEADLIFVRLDDWSQTEIIEGINYILDRAGSQPVVINMSLGRDSGPHDGSWNYEVEIDSLFSGTTQRQAIVISSGNDGNDQRHYQGEVPGAGEHEFEFVVRGDDDEIRSMEIWYDAPHELDVTVTPPGKEAEGPSAFASGSTTYVLEDESEIQINNNDNHALNGDNEIFISLDPADKKHLRSGDWKVKLFNSNPDPVPFHVWLTNDDGSYPYFKEEIAVVESTMGSPACAREAIAVGNYIVKGSNAGKLNASSGRGPTRDGRQGVFIAAPGTQIIAARGNAAGCCEKFWCWCCLIEHTSKTGTSMAAPHVAGTIALMLEKNPDLTLDEIRTHLSAGLTQGTLSGDGISNPDFHWGAGRLDVKQALDNVPAGSGPSPPTPVITALPYAAVAAAEQVANHFFFKKGDLELLYQRLLTKREGQQFDQVVQKHAREIWELINHNKRVAVVWHRIHGPRLVSLAMNALAFPDREVPRSWQGEPLQPALQRMSETIRKYGSAELGKDLDVYGARLIGMLGLSVNEILSDLK